MEQVLHPTDARIELVTKLQDIQEDGRLTDVEYEYLLFLLTQV